VPLTCADSHRTVPGGWVIRTSGLALGQWSVPPSRRGPPLRAAAPTAAPCPVGSAPGHSRSPGCFPRLWGWSQQQRPGLVGISHDSGRLPAGLSTALVFPCLRKTPCAQRSAALLWIELDLEQLPSVTDRFAMHSHLSMESSPDRSRNPLGKAKNRNSGAILVTL